MPARRRALLVTGAGVATALGGCLGSLPTGSSSSSPDSCSEDDVVIDSASGSAAWRQFRSDARNTSFVAGSAGPTTGVDVEWRIEHDESLNEPVVDEAIFVVDQSHGDDAEPSASVMAIDRTDGDDHWTVDGVAMARRTPALTDESLFSIDGSGLDRTEILALDRSDGTERWRETVPGAGVSPPTTAGDRVIVTSDVGVVAFEAATGAVDWIAERFERENEYDQGPERTMPTVSESVVHTVKSSDGDAGIAGEDGAARPVHAFDLETGELRWEVDIELPEGFTISDHQVVGDEHLFVPTQFSPAGPAGESLSSSGTFSGGPDGANGIVGAVDETPDDDLGRLYAIDRSAGEVAWELDFEKRLYHAPAYADGFLFVPTMDLEDGGELHVIDAADRTCYWREDLAFGNVGTPAVTSEALYYGAGTEIVARDVADGTERWRFEIPDAGDVTGAIGTPVVADDELYVRTGSDSNELTELLALTES